MPELPDVELDRRFFARHALGKPIAEVRVLAPTSVREGSPRALRDALVGTWLVESRRHGKWLLARTRRGPWLVLHFGMTGSLKVLKDGDCDPPHDRVEIDFEDGTRLAFMDQRRFGGVRLVPDADAFLVAHKLGPDALEIDRRTFEERLQRRRGKAKGVLMDQGFVAGLGNLYADEVLFQAGVHPLRSVETLKPAEARRLYDAMVDVLETAIAANTDASKLPGEWLLPHRQVGEACPRGGGAVEKLSVEGRSTYFCPRHQPLAGRGTATRTGARG